MAATTPPPPQNVQETTQGPVVTYGNSPAESGGEKLESKPKFAIKNVFKLPEGLTKYKKYIKIAAILIVVLIVLSIVLSVITSLSRRNGNNVIATPTPTASGNGEEITNPSIYADDPEVAAITEEINKLDESLKDSDFRESPLSLPLLDWDVNF